jgi:hypothetical protein
MTFRLLFCCQTRSSWIKCHSFDTSQNGGFVTTTDATEGPIQKQEQGDDHDANKSAALLLLPVPGGGESCSVSEQHYVESGNEKTVLFLMCIGLNRKRW